MPLHATQPGMQRKKLTLSLGEVTLSGLKSALPRTGAVEFSGRPISQNIRNCLRIYVVARIAARGMQQNLGLK